VDQLLPVILVSVFIALIVFKNIKKVTENIDIESLKNPNAKYGDFSAHVQEYIRDIRSDIKKESSDDVIFVLRDTKKAEQASEILSDFIRKLVFFETTMSKNRTKEQIESELAGILINLDGFVKGYIQNGDVIAEKMRDDLQARFAELQR